MCQCCVAVNVTHVDIAGSQERVNPVPRRCLHRFKTSVDVLLHCTRQAADDHGRGAAGVHGGSHLARNERYRFKVTWRGYGKASLAHVHTEAAQLVANGYLLVHLQRATANREWWRNGASGVSGGAGPAQHWGLGKPGQARNAPAGLWRAGTLAPETSRSGRSVRYPLHASCATLCIRQLYAVALALSRRFYARAPSLLRTIHNDGARALRRSVTSSMSAAQQLEHRFKLDSATHHVTSWSITYPGDCSPSRRVVSKMVRR